MQGELCQHEGLHAPVDDIVIGLVVLAGLLPALRLGSRGRPAPPLGSGLGGRPAPPLLGRRLGGRALEVGALLCGRRGGPPPVVVVRVVLLVVVGDVTLR